ncbi:MAG TPA: hypothetical protein ENN61_06290 [Bacteroidaceae bacterium]|nr:hypothetical protein [Bacteroidaceae bacterium]
MHTHILANGMVISHAHPYDKSNDSQPYKSHQHSNAELLFLGNQDILFLVVFVALTLKVLFKITGYLLREISFFILYLFNANRSRAPPIS